MLKNFCGLFILFLSLSSFGQTLIPDANFEQFLIDQGIDTNGFTGDILNADAQVVTNLNVTRNDIVDFTGLEAFVNLVTLNAGTNQFPSLPLNLLTLLEELTFNQNVVLTGLDLSTNINLRRLDIRANGGTNTAPMAILDLTNNTLLEYVHIYNFRNLANVVFPDTDTVEYIYLLQTAAGITVDFSGYDNLETLSLSVNFSNTLPINAILPNNQTALKSASFQGGNIINPNLSNFLALEFLSFQNSNVETLDLPITTTLKRIRITSHNITTINFQDAFGLENLEITNKISPGPLNLDITNNLQLLSLNAQNNNLINLDVTQNTLIEDIDVSNNELPTIDISQNTALVDLNASRNLITTLDLSQNIVLEDLNLTTNELPTIDVSDNILLEDLLLGQNELPSLDVTNNPELFRLNISENLFTTSGLDLTQNPRLDNLDASNNQIESLNITQNPRLGTLNLNNNLFTGTDIIDQYHTIWSNQGALNASDRLDVSFNQLSGRIPDFASLIVDRTTNYFEFRFNDNNFEFGDFEAEHAEYVAALTNTWSSSPFLPFWRDYDYAPQAKVNTIETPTRNAGDNITLLTEVRGAQNHYTWFKDGIEIPDAPDSPELILNDLNTCDAGLYYAEITSDLVPFENANPPGTNGKNLLLIRNDITLTINATRECVTLDMPLTNVPINSGVQWNDTPGACGYRISVGTTSGATNVVNNEDVGEVTVYNFPSDLNPNQDYFVTITPYYDDGDLNGCTEETFRTNSTTVVPECTFLSSPSNGDTNIATDLSRIEWNPANGADEYDITISSPSGANDITTTTTDAFLTISNDFNQGEIVTITIVPTNTVGDATGCSPATESFTIAASAPTPPDCTNLASPVDGDTDVAIDLNEITWDDVANATQYRITIDGSTSNLNDETNLIVSGTSHSFTNNFDNGETVTVTIVPINGTVEPTIACGSESFTIVAAPPTGNAFITTWQTTTANEDITIPTTGGGYNYTVDWGDGAVTTGENGDATHTYTAPDMYTVSITGDFPRIYFNTNGNPTATDNSAKILTIEQWGDNPWTSMFKAFTGCINLTGNFSDIPDLSGVTNTSGMFATCRQFNSDIDNWNMSSVTNMAFMFQNNASFNQPLNSWDVSGVDNMFIMFQGARNFDQPLDNWNVENVTNADRMLDQVSLSTANYDALLIAWNAQNLQPDVLFSGGDSQYCEGASARANMIASDGWIISDDGTAGPTVADLTDQTHANSYTLPNITGTQLTGGEAYYTETNGGGTRYNIGETVNFTDFPSYPVTLYIYDGASTCASEESFELILTQNLTPPACTTLSDPLNGASNVSLDTDISWNAIPNADGYRLSVGTTSGGNNILNNLDVGNVLTYDLPTDLPENSAIFVIIIPYNSFGDAIGCNDESFTTETVAAVPDCTMLSSPVDGATNISISTDLTWNAISNADGYRLTIGTTSGGNDILDNIDLGNVLTYNPPTDFAENTEIFVTVVPYNGVGDATGCIEESFTTETIADVPICTMLLNPLDGDTNVSITTDLDWNAILEATGYQLTVGTISGGNDILDSFDMGNVLTYDLPIDLPENTEIFITIVPYNGVGDAVGCAEESFVTETLGSVPECTSLSAALINATTVSVSSDLTWDAVGNTDGYWLTVGTTSGGNDILDNLDVGNVLTYELPTDLPFEQQIFVTITPYNSNGDATGCTEQSFTTMTEPTSPACTNLLTPLNLDIDVPVNTLLSWNAATNAAGYRLTVGTVSGIGDIINDQDIGNVTSFNLPNNLPENTEIFVFILPYNATGDGEFCEEESFITETLAPNTPPCTTITTPENGSTDVPVATGISWNAIGDIDGYIISIGTTEGGTDLLDNFDVGLTTSYDLLEDLPFEQEIFVSVLLYNETGISENCEVHSFTTIPEPEVESLYGFSPDGDGINEFWVIEGIENYPDNTVVIYNRWGDMVFQIDGYDNNSNVFRGEANQLTGFGAGQLPEGTYFFQLILPQDNNLKQTKGFLVLKR